MKSRSDCSQAVQKIREIRQEAGQEDMSDWCRHIFRESNEAADTHANWLMDNCDS